MKFSRVAAALALLSVATTPTLAAAAGPREAAFASSADPSRAETRVFAGVSLRVRGDRVEPTLALSSLRGRSGEAARVDEGVRLSLATSPRLTFAGQDAADLKRRQQLNGGQTAMVVVGGLALAALILVLVAREEMDDEPII